MKINREMIIRAALKLLNEAGIEELTLRRLGQELRVQAATIYWHFKCKEELLDEMASSVLAEGIENLLPRNRVGDWSVWAETFGKGLRKTLLAYRDGGRMVSGTKLTNDAFIKATAILGSRLIEEGFSVRAAAVLGATIYNYTLSFVIEEQAVLLYRSKYDPLDFIEKRKTRLSPIEFPFHSKTSNILFTQYDRRYREGLDLILRGADPEAMKFTRRSAKG